MMRTLLNKKYNDQTSSSLLLSESGFLSINQIMAQIKLTEIWKAFNNENYPIKVTKMKDVLPERYLRSKVESEKILLEVGVTEISKKTFTNDGIKLWNRCPSVIKTEHLFTLLKKR